VAKIESIEIFPGENGGQDVAFAATATVTVIGG
jgi:hypothetical protein